jgi:hypothetical protein
MRERQPHGPHLLPARKETVENTPRDDEMRARVEVREREPETMVMDGGERAGDGDGCSDDERRAA